MFKQVQFMLLCAVLTLGGIGCVDEEAERQALLQERQELTEYLKTCREQISLYRSWSNLTEATDMYHSTAAAQDNIMTFQKELDRTQSELREIDRKLELLGE